MVSPPITIEAELDGKECNLCLIGADFMPKTGDTIWVRHEPFEGFCFHVHIKSIVHYYDDGVRQEKFFVEEV